jgi:hypothetical protein
MVLTRVSETSRSEERGILAKESNEPESAQGTSNRLVHYYQRKKIRSTLSYQSENLEF